MKQKNTSINKNVTAVFLVTPGPRGEKTWQDAAYSSSAAGGPRSLRASEERDEPSDIQTSDSLKMTVASRYLPFFCRLFFFLRFVQTAESELSGKHQLGSLISRLFILDKSFFFFFLPPPRHPYIIAFYRTVPVIPPRMLQCAQQADTESPSQNNLRWR